MTGAGFFWRPALAKPDGLLARFRALLRITAVEGIAGRQSGVEAMSLSGTLEQAIELYDPLAADKGIALKAAIEPGVDVRADAELMFEAVSNLIDNALKFTPKGGVVQVSLMRSDEGPVVTVRDTGVGIAPAERQLVTKRFYRSPTVGNVPGHGLGLSLVNAVADSYMALISASKRVSPAPSCDCCADRARDRGHEMRGVHVRASAYEREWTRPCLWRVSRRRSNRRQAREPG